MSKLRLLIGMAVLLVAAGQTHAVICGDIDNTGRIDISDLVYLVDYMFNDGPPLPYPPAADCAGDGQIDISDLVCWVDHWFMGAPSPTCPFWSVDNHTDIGGTCVPDSAVKTDVPHTAAFDNGFLYLEVVGNDLYVHHFHAFYQCCLFYAVDWNQSGNHLVGFEADTGMPCDCICPFNLKSIVHDLEPGEYVVTLVGIYGNIVGIDTAVVGGDGPVLIGYEDSGCIEPEPPGEPVIVDYTLAGDTLTMEHLNAYFNCAAEIVVDFALVGDTLRFYERNTYDSIPVPCYCFFEVTAMVAGIAPGEYVAEIYMQHYPLEPILMVDRRTLTLGADAPMLIGYEDSGCLENEPGDSPIINYYLSGDTLTMEHLDAYLNCVADIVVDFALVGDTLRFYEMNVSEEAVYCLCYFEVTAAVEGIQPGNYVAELYVQEYPDAAIYLFDRRSVSLGK